MLWENLFRIEKGLGWTYLGIKMVGKEFGDKKYFEMNLFKKECFGIMNG